MNNGGNLTVVALCVAAEMAFTNPSTNQNIPGDPNTGEPTTTEAKIDTSHSIKVGIGKEYERINEIASNADNKIVVSRNQAGGLANQKTAEGVKETLTEEHQSRSNRYGEYINPDDDKLSIKEEKSNLPPADCYVEDGIGYIAGRSLAKQSLEPEQVDKAVIICKEKGADTVDLNHYGMTPKLMEHLETEGMVFLNKKI